MSNISSWKAKFSSTIFIVLYVLMNMSAPSSAQEFDFGLNLDKSKKAEVTLTALENTVKAGETLHLAFTVKPIKNWHIYFENPGVGYPFSPNWELPEGAVGSKISFPTPKVMKVAGSVSYVYENEVTLLAEVTVPQGSGSFTVKSNASYLICDDKICIPEEAELEVTLDYGDGKSSFRKQQSFEKARSHFAKVVDWDARFYAENKKTVRVEIKIPKSYDTLAGATLYPRTFDLMEYRLEEKMLFANGTLYFELEAMDGVEDIQNFDFIIRLKRADGTDESFDIKAVKNTAALPAKFTASDNLDFSANLESLSLWTALLFAFLGGIILNLMPCVFPILSLKALGLIEMAKKSPAQARMSGNIYTLGVLTCFAGIAALMLGLRYAGEMAGWGFHMQMPLVNLTLGLIMVAVALNLLGVFEIGSHLGGVGQGLTKGSKHKESFFTGFLAVIVATPCSAPFMAPALGYGSFAPAVNSFFVFMFLGLGLAFPYLLLCYYSGFRKIMPRPGNWMISMRKILSFPMFLTALWLFWILGKQTGVDGMALAVLAAVMMSFAIFSGVRKGAFWKITAVISFAAMSYFTYSIYTLRTDDIAAVSGNDILVSEDFTTEKMVKYVEEERPLFIYFTADWCVTCKVNETGVLGTEKVAKLFKKHQVTVLKGDMTNDNPEVVKILRKFGRIGVPLYVFYPKGAKLSDPIILPQILSYSVMAELFEG